MAAFGLHFLACNLSIAMMILVLLAARRLAGGLLPVRMRCCLWLVMLGLFTVPFLPLRSMGLFRLFDWMKPIRFSRLLSWMNHFHIPDSGNALVSGQAVTRGSNLPSGDWMNAFGFSVEAGAGSYLGYVLAGLWLAGMVVMSLLLVRSAFRLRRLKRSALPLQDEKVGALYRQCRKELGIKREIPVYSTAFLTSPMMTGCLRPGIYLPIRLITECPDRELRHMLLHELQHFQHKDAWINLLSNLAGVIYWLNPLVWYGLKEMKNDLELACDASVLDRLEPEEYKEYGYTLLRFARRMSLSSFASGLGGSGKQIRRRIEHIASYRVLSRRRQMQGWAALGVIVLLLTSFVPALITYGGDEESYHWEEAEEEVSCLDGSQWFGGLEGCFVLYEEGRNQWTVYGEEHATRRTPPYSTFKIYDALMGLEAGVILPEESRIPWDGNDYPFASWNQDHDLKSAMNQSVNWYFQSLDEQVGTSGVRDFVNDIGYGNRKLTGDSPSFWLNSDLKISPMEQVELLRKMNQNTFSFAPEHVAAVKDAILLDTSSKGTLYGKTGTGQVDGQDSDGWFVGYVENGDHEVCYFAVHVSRESRENENFSMQTQAEAEGGKADGKTAADIALRILLDLGIWD